MRIRELTAFYKLAIEDNRIATTHISLYMALFELWNQNNFHSPVGIKRQHLMEAAKISGLATYHKVITDLHEFGYIVYRPSRNHRVPSQVEFVKLF